MNIDELIDEALTANAEAILLNKELTNEETQQTLSVMIRGLQKSVNSWYEDNSVAQKKLADERAKVIRDDPL